MIYDNLRENAVRVDPDEVGFPTRVAAAADLIAVKEHANRDVDRIDLTALRMALGEEAWRGERTRRSRRHGPAGAAGAVVRSEAG
jgi:hypothetical protein